MTRWAARNRAVAVAVVLAVVALAACGGGGNSSATRDGASSTSEAVTTVSSASSSSVSDDVAAKGLVVQLADLGTGWTQLRDEAIPVAQLNPPVGCAPAGVLAPGRRSAGTITEFSFNLDRSGNEEGHAVSLEFIQATTGDASQTEQRLEAAGYLSCFQQEAVSSVEDATQSPTQDASVAVLPFPNSIAGAAGRVTVHYTFQGSTNVLYDDFFDFIVGRVESRISRSRCCTPFDDATEAAIVQAVHDRAAASPLAM